MKISLDDIRNTNWIVWYDNTCIWVFHFVIIIKFVLKIIQVRIIVKAGINILPFSIFILDFHSKASSPMNAKIKKNMDISQIGKRTIFNWQFNWQLSKWQLTTSVGKSVAYTWVYSRWIFQGEMDFRPYKRHTFNYKGRFSLLICPHFRGSKCLRKVKCVRKV